MKKAYFAYPVMALAALGLAACGGGGSDDSDGGVDPGTNVSGTFYDARITGNTYSEDLLGLGGYGDECIGQNHYFEDDNGRIRVYGSAGFSETTFREMATHIDDNLDSVMGLFNTTWSSFVSQRQLLTLSSMSRILKSHINADGSVKEPLADNFDSWDTTSASDSYASWLGMTEEQRRQTIADVATMLDQSAANGAFISEDEYPMFQERSFVVACLHPTMGGNTSGEGTVPGIVLTANPSSYDGNFSKLVKHELVHFVQGNLTRVGGQRRSLPRWFAEGQAVVFSGMSYHSPSAHYNYEPLDVISIGNETGDPGEAYKHYGLAYNYLDRANGKARMADMLWAIRQVTVNPFNEGLPMEDYSPQFTNGFDATMVDHNGNPLTFSDYRTNYHDIMNTQY